MLLNKRTHTHTHTHNALCFNGNNGYSNTPNVTYLVYRPISLSAKEPTGEFGRHASYNSSCELLSMLTTHKWTGGDEGKDNYDSPK